MLYVLPYKALVAEKVAFARRIFGPHFRRSKLGIGAFFGSQGGSKRLMNIELAIGTPERLSSLFNSLVHAGRLDTIGAVVVDEIHYLGNPSRGHKIEALLAKVLFACERLGQHIQIVGMTATIGNQEVLAKWLNAISFKADIPRPVPLRQFIVCTEGVFTADGRKAEQFSLPKRPYEGSNQIAAICELMHAEEHKECQQDHNHREKDSSDSQGKNQRRQLLVFCPTKSRADEEAKALKSLLTQGTPTSHGGDSGVGK